MALAWSWRAKESKCKENAPGITTNEELALRITEVKNQIRDACAISNQFYNGRTTWPMDILWNIYLETHPEQAENVRRGDELISHPPSTAAMQLPPETYMQCAQRYFSGWSSHLKRMDEHECDHCNTAPFLCDIMRQRPEMADFVGRFDRSCEAQKLYMKGNNALYELQYLQKSKVLSSTEIVVTENIATSISQIDKLLRATKRTKGALKALCIGIKDDVPYYFARDENATFDRIDRAIMLSTSTAPKIHSSIICVIDPVQVLCVARQHGEWITSILTEFGKDPVNFIESVCVRVGCCCVCNRSLTVSREAGVGPICRKYLSRIINN